MVPNTPNMILLQLKIAHSFAMMSHLAISSPTETKMVSQALMVLPMVLELTTAFSPPTVIGMATTVDGMSTLYKEMVVSATL
jgi:hypothetical protein